MLVQSSISEDRSHLEFQTLPCTFCRHTIRGSSFRCVAGCHFTRPINGNVKLSSKSENIILCEDCAREGSHEASHLVKVTKHCILSKGTSDLEAHELCSCGLSKQVNVHFPFTHRVRETHAATCALLQLANQHVKARYDDLVISKRLSHSENDQLVGNDPNTGSGARLSKWNSALNKLSGKGSVTKNSISKTLIGRFVRPAAKIAVSQVRYGNVHMSLSIGPIVIENGVPE
jgi:hypothetical protein